MGAGSVAAFLLARATVLWTKLLEPRDNEVLFDVRTAGNLQRLGPQDLASFPPPAFRGCGGPYRVCHLENACISRYDGVILVNSSSARAIEQQYLRRVTAPATPTKIRLLPADTFRALQRVHLVRGHAFAVSCWRKNFDGLGSTNPSHYIMGHGKLFVAATDASVPRPLSTLIMHQCARFSHGTTREGRPVWGWARGVWALIESKAVQMGLWSPSTVNTIVLGLAWARGKGKGKTYPNPRGLPSGFDHVVCAEKLLVEPGHVAQYLGANRPEVVGAWRAHVRARVPLNGSGPETGLESGPGSRTVRRPAQRRRRRESEAAGRGGPDGGPGGGPSGAPSGRVRRTATALCTSALRVALWQRESSSPRGRHLRNVAQIRGLVARYTTHPMMILTATSDTEFARQVANFHEFDVLITPHGSHLTNMLFASPAAIFIEVVMMHVDDAPCRNGRAFARSWLMAYGRHLPLRTLGASPRHAASPHRTGPDGSLSLGGQAGPRVSVDWARASRMASVHAGRDARFRKVDYKEPSVLVDMATLDAAIQRAIGIACAGAPRRHECGTPPEAKRNASVVAPTTTLCCAPCDDACAHDCDATCALGSVYSCPRNLAKVCAAGAP